MGIGDSKDSDSYIAHIEIEGMGIPLVDKDGTRLFDESPDDVLYEQTENIVIHTVNSEGEDVWFTVEALTDDYTIDDAIEEAEEAGYL